MKEYLKFNKDGWCIGLSTGSHRSPQEEIKNNVFLTDKHKIEHDRDGEVVSNNIKLLFNELAINNIIVKTQAERDAYDEEQLEIARLKARDELNEVSKLELYVVCKELDLLDLFNGFKQITEFEFTNDINLKNPVVVEAMADLPNGILDTIKYKIILDREV